jgi:ABC-type uncharacterized transport system involved in gliding motility auxiliary subunit
MSTPVQRRLTSSSLLLLALAFIAAVIISNQLFSGWRIDLTENNLYTLSPGTKRILGNIDEPINLHFYFSDRATENLPSLRGYANRVREMLEEFEDRSDGNIQLRVVDPLPFSEEEDRAAQFDLQGIRLASSPDPIYLGLAGTNSVGDEATIAFFQPDKEEFLEYDIAKLVSTLAQPGRTAIGLISGVRMSGDFDPETQQMLPPWVIYQQAQQLFDVRDLGTDVDVIDEDIGLLWIVQPKDLSEQALYAIDQYVLAGGKALIFVDPLAEADASSVPGMPQGMPPQGQGSDLPSLFSAWGVEFSSTEVLADSRLALQIAAGMNRRPVRHLGLLGITPSELNQSDITTADLESINVGTAGSIEVAGEDGATFEPLIQSSDRAAMLPVSRFSFLPDPSALLDGFSPGDQPLAIAGRLRGALKTAFPDGLAETAAADDANGASQAADPVGEREHLTESTDAANIILVADVDMLSDRMWVQTQSFFGQQMATAFADNGTFVTNALDNLSGSNDLIDVRSRATSARPFTRVDDLRREAETRFRETEQNLQRELDETEQRLTSLESAREDAGNLLMTEEQQAEIDRFIDRRAEIRQELRAVQRGLDRDIERLGTTLKVINIALVPLVMTLFVLFAVWRRSRGLRA